MHDVTRVPRELCVGGALRRTSGSKVMGERVQQLEHALLLLVHRGTDEVVAETATLGGDKNGRQTDDLRWSFALRSSVAAVPPLY